MEIYTWVAVIICSIILALTSVLTQKRRDPDINKKEIVLIFLLLLGFFIVMFGFAIPKVYHMFIDAFKWMDVHFQAYENGMMWSAIAKATLGLVGLLLITIAYVFLAYRHDKETNEEDDKLLSKENVGALRSVIGFALCIYLFIILIALIP